MTSKLSRRDFVISAATATGGLLVGLTVPGYAAEFADKTWAADSADPREVNAWVVIQPDETVILRCPMAEMGQGTGSGLPMLLAEELECDWSKVKVEFSSVNRNIRENNIYGDQLTAGSRGIRTTWPYVQQAGASARARPPGRWRLFAAQRGKHLTANDCCLPLIFCGRSGLSVFLRKRLCVHDIGNRFALAVGRGGG